MVVSFKIKLNIDKQINPEINPDEVANKLYHYFIEYILSRYPNDFTLHEIIHSNIITIYHNDEVVTPGYFTILDKMVGGEI